MSSEGPSTLGAHLAEMDRLLRDIQAELMPDREPAPPLSDPSAAGVPAAPVTGPAVASAAPRAPAFAEQIQALTELATRLVASMRELLVGYERVVAQTSPTPSPGHRRAVSAPPEAVTLAAGPFPGLAALREFEQAVAGLPGVREVAVQAYEGSDRAVIEVRLGNP